MTTLSALDQLLAPEPTPALDVATTGTIDNLVALDVSGNLVSVVRFTGAGAVTLNGLTPGVTGYCRRIHLMAVGGALTIADNAAGSLAANRIRTGTGANVTIAQNGAAWLVYDVTAQVWRLSNGAGGGSGITPPVGATTGDLLIYSAGAWNRLPIGTSGQLLQVVSGLPSWVTPFDPSTLAWSGLWRDFSSAPWLGSPSNGASSGRPLSVVSAGPTLGGAFGSHASAAFNGSTQYLQSTSLFYDSFVTRTAYYGECIFSLSSVSAPGTQPYQDAALISDNGGNIYLGVSTSGIQFGHYDDVSFKSTRTTSYIACSTGAKHLAQFWYDGVNLNLRLDGGSVVQTAAGSLSTTYSAIKPRIGANFDGTVFLNGSIARVGLMNAVPSSTVRDQLRVDAASNYGTL